MALKTTLAAGLAAITMLFMPVGAAEAKTKIVIGIGIGTPGLGGYYCGKHNWRCRSHPYVGGYYVKPRLPLIYYGGGYYGGGYNVGGRKLSCAAARNIVDHSGYNKVKANDCSGKVYSFVASRKGHRVLVRVNARNGNIISSNRI